MSTNLSLIKWILRIAVCCIFVGHGYFAFIQNENWLPYLEVVGFDHEMAMQIMPIIGLIDFGVAISTLIKPNNYVLAYASFWAFAAALIRPISGAHFLAFVERAGNWCTPLVLMLLNQKDRK